MVRSCKVCGTVYKTCYVCEKERSWRLHTDTLEHYYILTVLMEYQSDHDAKAAYAALRKRGIDTRITAGYEPNVQTLLSEINASVQSTSKAKETDTVVLNVDADEAESDNAEE